MSATFSRNPGGKNQYADIPKGDDPVLIEALTTLHRELMSDDKILMRLAHEYGINMSKSSLKRRKKALGLTGSRTTSRIIPEQEQERLVLNAMSEDLGRKMGPRMLCAKLALKEGVHLRRDFVASIMHNHDPQGFDLRGPTSKQIHQFPKVPLGIHERWSADGHDKLNHIGFQVWAIVDDATTRFLDAWVVPSNRHGHTLGYLFLCLVEKFGGIPLQLTTDHGSEITHANGLVHALRQIFQPDFDRTEIHPAHVYLQSIHNISFEPSSLRLRLGFGDTAVRVFEQGIADGVYNSRDPNHVELCYWLWAILIRQELHDFVALHNAYKTRKDKKKPGPSGMSRNEAFAMPEQWGGRNLLLPVNIRVIQEIKAVLKDDAVLDFSTPEFSAIAEQVYNEMNISKLTFNNVWYIFQEMLPLVFP